MIRPFGQGGYYKPNLTFSSDNWKSSLQSTREMSVVSSECLGVPTPVYPTDYKGLPWILFNTAFINLWSYEIMPKFSPALTLMIPFTVFLSKSFGHIEN